MACGKDLIIFTGPAALNRTEHAAICAEDGMEGRNGNSHTVSLSRWQVVTIDGWLIWLLARHR